MVMIRLIIFMLIMIMLPIISANSQSHQNITLGSVLTAGDENATWISPSGEFAFGFRQVKVNGYLLAVVFAKTSQRTIAWSANGDHVAEIGSKVQLSEDGSQLVLTGPNGRRIWAANFSGSGVAHGAMLDTGNFVLVGKDSKFLWQSFNEPTDTLLPEQVLNQNGSLFSSLNETDHSRGQFKLIMQADNNLVLYTLNYPFEDINGPAYWASNTVSKGISQAIFNESGYFFVVYQNGTINNVFSQAVNSSKFYKRLTLDIDGVLRLYVHPKPASTDDFWSVHGFIPPNICEVVGGNRGGGVCGYNSVCTLVDHRPECRCPDGYSFWDTRNKMAGCKPDFTRQGCNRNSTGGFKLVELNSTEWPDSEYEYYGSVSEDMCSESCLKDCFCDAAFFRNGECWKNSIPLRHGRFNPVRGGKTWMKLPGNK
ncbi:hypothetical protein CASFOL_035340 [Castilleja foliolosa]|uniref:Bulb-type lectin domain-containing protein n=1 Tax=Castilleja foliolosa TaxID=1961234 RepID=A0ABD3BSB8_9LAMI